MTRKGRRSSAVPSHLPRVLSRNDRREEQPRHGGGEQAGRGMEFRQAQDEGRETVNSAGQQRAGESRHPAPAQKIASDRGRTGIHGQQPLPACEAAEVRLVEVDGEHTIQGCGCQAPWECGMRSAECGVCRCWIAHLQIPFSQVGRQVDVQWQSLDHGKVCDAATHPQSSIRNQVSLSERPARFRG